MITKLDKQKSKFEKSLTTTKVELDGANQTIQDLKSQVVVIDAQKVKQVEVELQTIITTNKVLSNSNSKLLLLVEDFKISLVEQVKDRMLILSHLHLLQEQALQTINKFNTQTALHQLALDIPRSILEKMQS